MVTTGVIALAASFFALLAAGTGMGAAIFWLRKDHGQPSKKGAKGPQEAYLEVLSGRVASLEVGVAALPSLWEEERERAKKHADRAMQAERDLEKRIERIAEQLDEGEDVLGADVEGGEGSGVLPLLAPVGEHTDDDFETRAAQALAQFGRRF